MTPVTSPGQGRLAAVWFADIVGYTSLAAQDHARALAVVDRFQDQSRRVIDAHGGRLVKFIGDGALAEFASTGAALQAASDLQREFSECSVASGRHARLRIGVHLGEIEAAADGDIYGDGVNTASRLQAEAEPGHILVSEDVRRSLRSHPEFAFAPAGRRRLRGTTAPMAVFEALPPTGTADHKASRFSAQGLAWLRGWRLLTLLALHASAGWLLVSAIRRLALRGAVSEVAHDIAFIWYVGGFSLLLLIGWFHGYRRHRHTTVAEKGVLSSVLLVLLVLTGVAVARSVAREQARNLAIAGGLDPRRVAVLYFDALGGDTTQAYLAAAFTQDLIEALSDVRALDVVSANGVAPFRGRQMPPDSIARMLEAGTIVDGSLEQTGGMMRVNVRLIDGVGGGDVRRAGFELPATDLFAVRSGMVERVAGFLREWLGEEVRLQQSRAGTDNVAAWALVHRGAEQMRRGEHALEQEDGAGASVAFETADSLLAQAAMLDTSWPQPVVMRGRIAYEISRATHDPHEAAAWNEQARAFAATALDRDANDAAALELRGTTSYWLYLLDVTTDAQEHEALLTSARADLEEAVQVDPARASAHSTLSHLYYNYDIAAAVLAARRAYEEDAYLTVADAVVWRLFNGSLDLGQFTQAERWCEVGRKRFPERYQFTSCRLMLMVTPALDPDVDEAWRLAVRVDSVAGSDEHAYARALSHLSVGGVLARAGMLDSARSVLLRTRESITYDVDPQQELLAYEAFMRTLTGDEDEAIGLLKRYAAANPGHFGASGGNETAWWWRSLQDRPWFREVAAH